jgi:predicted RNase H-like HicB family nuclease
VSTAETCDFLEGALSFLDKVGRIETMRNTIRYAILIDGRRGGYGVVFPDLPGCTVMGRTFDEALRHATEAVSEWAQAVKVPRPRSLEVLRDGGFSPRVKTC